jgi:F-type H+-transporting ATPase subunit delta
MAYVATAYASAFADVILNQKLDPQNALTGLRQIVTLMAESPALRDVWKNPAISLEQKRKLLDVIVERDDIGRPVRNLVAVMIDHHRVRFLDRVVTKLEKELDARLGFVQADIKTVRELSDTEKRALEGQIGQLTGKKVRSSFAHDASLLGGVVVRIGSTIYDGSVKGQLKRIRAQIASE